MVAMLRSMHYVIKVLRLVTYYPMPNVNCKDAKAFKKYDTLKGQSYLSHLGTFLKIVSYFQNSRAVMHLKCIKEVASYSDFDSL